MSTIHSLGNRLHQMLQTLRLNRMGTSCTLEIKYRGVNSSMNKQETRRPLALLIRLRSDFWAAVPALSSRNLVLLSGHCPN